MLSPTREFCRDAVFFLQVDWKGAFKGGEFIMTRDCDSWSECGVSSLLGFMTFVVFLGKLILMSLTGHSVISRFGFSGDLRYLSK
jgi:hypothetical protein